MNTALSWIKAYVPELECSGQEYLDALTLSGTKVETYECLDKNLKDIYVGQILSIERHPDADKLIICQVDIGSEVTQMQAALLNLGYSLEVTGRYDAATVSAVQTFQRNNRLSADGVAGPITLGALYSGNAARAGASSSGSAAASS